MLKKLTALMMLLILCSCTNPEKQLSKLTFQELMEANSYGKVGLEHFVYVENQMDDAENSREYSEYSQINDILAYTDEYYQNDELLFSAVAAMQESDNSYGLYYISQEENYVLLLDFPLFNQLTDDLWYTSHFNSTNDFTAYEITKRQITENGDYYLEVTENDERKLTFTLEKDTLYIKSCNISYYQQDKLIAKEEIKINIEDKAIMIPKAYNQLIGNGECQLIFRSLDGDIDVIYHLASGCHYYFAFGNLRVYDNESGENDLSTNSFYAQPGTTIYYTKKKNEQ